jgi:site-specific DNA-methyltransferase (adenine-specific)
VTPYYDDGQCVIYHGDCREVDAWLAADVLVTDPPYGVHHSKHGMNDVAVTGESRTGRSATRVLTDEHVDVRNAALALWGDRPALVFGHWRAPRPTGTQMRLVWDKCMIGMGGVGAWRPSDEEIYVLGWPNPKHEGGSLGSIIRSDACRGAERPDHPSPKPLSLMRQLLQHCPPGTIADPFCGSGTTLRAAKDLDRRGIGVELEERYCEIAANRLAQGVLDFGTATA